MKYSSDKSSSIINSGTLDLHDCSTASTIILFNLSILFSDKLSF